MRAIAAMLFGVVSAVGTCVLGAGVATYILAMPDGQQLANLNTPDLWTAAPERVDTLSQKFERVAPLVSAAYPITARVTKPKTDLASNSASGNTASDSAAASLRNEHEQWCASRYRSYDPASNTYRSYSGQMRSCVSPITSPSMEITGSVSGGADHTAWCSTRYSSYRAQDNTYQPYNGPRRACTSPFPENSGAETASR